MAQEERDGGYRNLWKATHCSLGFFVLSISVNSVQNVQSQALEDDGYDKLGFFQLAVLYMCLGIGSLFATPAMRRLGPKFCMIIGSLFDFLWIIASLIPALKFKWEHDNPNATDSDMPLLYRDEVIYSTAAITSVLGGLGEAVQWVAQGKYIAECATLKTKGFFFGYFWAFYMASQIFGCLMSIIVFQAYDLIAFYMVMGCFALLSAVIFLFLRDPIPSTEAIEERPIIRQEIERHSEDQQEKDYNTRNGIQSDGSTRSSSFNEAPIVNMNTWAQAKKDVRATFQIISLILNYKL